MALQDTLEFNPPFPLSQNSDLKHATDNEFVKTVGEIREKFA